MAVSTGEGPRLLETNLRSLSLCAPGKYILGVWVMDQSIGPCLIAGIKESRNRFWPDKIR